MAEGVGFEPTFAKKDENGFQDRHHKPLGHPSWLQILLQSDPFRQSAALVPASLYQILTHGGWDIIALLEQWELVW
jgi:hypothetical protein